MTSPTGRYCIIGAGAAGLGALRELSDLGASVDCFEGSSRVGGHWNTDYDSLHLITSRDTSGFPGYPMPSDFPIYPSRGAMVRYLNAFCDHYRLRERIAFNTEVVSCEPEGARGHDGWIITTTQGSSQRYDGVIVANGHLWSPRIPDVASSYTGTSIHSGSYHNSRQITGQPVLVVGAGNSGCDLAVDAAQAGLAPTIVVRRGQVFQPKSVFGSPRAEIRWLSALPKVVQERVNRLLVKVVIGPYSAYPGLPAPRTANLNELPPVVNNLLPYYIQHGLISVVPAIREIDGKVVHFVDGSYDLFETILWATGFDVRFPFLANRLMSWSNGVPLRVAAMTVPVGLNRLYFVGLSAPRGPQLPPYIWEARLIAKMLVLDQTAGPCWSERTFAGDHADDRIDIVRVDWMKQLRRAQVTVDKCLASLPRRNPKSVASSSARGSTSL